jgi:hypothetical protein
MARKKKIGFIMDTGWIIQPPIDSEYKQYVLLSYFQKMNEKLDNLEVYPSFIELSLHFASLQTLIKENKLVVTEKKFETVDDEVLMSDLVFKEIPPMSEEDTDEFKQILKYAAPKMFDYFNIAKSIWQIAYDSASVSIKKNKSELTNDNGFFYYSGSRGCGIVLQNNEFFGTSYVYTENNEVMRSASSSICVRDVDHTKFIKNNVNGTSNCMRFQQSAHIYLESNMCGNRRTINIETPYSEVTVINQTNIKYI